MLRMNVKCVTHLPGEIEVIFVTFSDPDVEPPDAFTRIDFTGRELPEGMWQWEPPTRDNYLPGKSYNVHQAYAAD